VRYVLFTFSGSERIADWQAMTAAEKDADIERVRAWFREHAAVGRIAGGEELAWPQAARTVRLRGVSDGPYIETKEMLGGFIIVDVESEAVALEMARTWPGIVHDSDRVEVWPVGSSEAEAAAQARREAAASSGDAPEEAGAPEAAG
jgi:hypothetical protein